MDTERASPRYSDIDVWEPLDIAEAMIEGQFTAVAAVRAARVSLVQAALAAQAVSRALPAPEAPGHPVPALSHDSNTALRKRAKSPPAPRVKGQSPAFDRTKFHLGPLCQRQHAYGRTGQSLRRNHKNKNQQHCLECVRENNRAYVHNKRLNPSS